MDGSRFLVVPDRSCHSTLLLQKLGGKVNIKRCWKTFPTGDAATVDRKSKNAIKPYIRANADSA